MYIISNFEAGKVIQKQEQLKIKFLLWITKNLAKASEQNLDIRKMSTLYIKISFFRNNLI